MGGRDVVQRRPRGRVERSVHVLFGRAHVSPDSRVVVDAFLTLDDIGRDGQLPCLQGDASGVRVHVAVLADLRHGRLSRNAPHLLNGHDKLQRFVRAAVVKLRLELRGLVFRERLAFAGRQCVHIGHCQILLPALRHASRRKDVRRRDRADALGKRNGIVAQPCLDRRQNLVAHLVVTVRDARGVARERAAQFVVKLAQRLVRAVLVLIDGRVCFGGVREQRRGRCVRISFKPEHQRTQAAFAQKVTHVQFGVRGVAPGCCTNDVVRPLGHYGHTDDG